MDGITNENQTNWEEVRESEPWYAAVHTVAKSQMPLGDWTTTKSMNSVVTDSGEQQGTQPYTHVHTFSPKPPSHPGCHITLSRIPSAIQ